MLVLDAGKGPSHATVLDLPRHLAKGSLLVVNDTRVVPARLFGTKRGSGGRVEILLTRKVAAGALSERWEALGKASKPLREGMWIDVAPEGRLAVEIVRGGPVLEVNLVATGDLPIERALEAVGHVPLPPYMHRADEASDRERYQTTFARVPGAVAAPTAGLHLSESLLSSLDAAGITLKTVTLHVSLGTFQPVSADDLDDHVMHAESFEVPEDTARALSETRARGDAVVAVGTTVVRTLESAADPEKPGVVRAGAGETRLLIQPGFAFRVVDRLLTNFHLPESTLLALVSAFAGRERVLSAYAEAIRERYRFFSYGDAMLVTRTERP